MAWDHKAPFDGKGNLMHYADATGSYSTYAAAEWRPIKEFDAQLSYVGYRRGRSAAYFLFEDVNGGPEYPMFLADFDERVAQKMIAGMIEGRWLVCKRGQNFGLQRIGDAKSR